MYFDVVKVFLVSGCVVINVLGPVTHLLLSIGSIMYSH